MSREDIGCCGAYCGTCRVLRDGACRGCKLGYATGERDLSKARCAIKICCITRHYDSCAECPDYDTCETVQRFHAKNGYKYKKYREAVMFIRTHGYDTFLETADSWSSQYGKYPKSGE